MVVEDLQSALNYVLSILQGQVEVITRLKNATIHDELSSDQALLNVILESAHVAEHLSLLRKKIVRDKLNVDVSQLEHSMGASQVRKPIKTNSETSNASDDLLASGINELSRVLEYLNQLRQEELNGYIRAVEMMQQKRLTSIGSADLLKNYSILQQLVRSGPVELFFEIALLLNGRDLLNLQLTSSSVRQWVQHHIFNTRVGTTAIQQRHGFWLKKDLSTLKTEKLSCKHRVDFISIDSKEFILASGQAGLTLFDRSNFENVMSQAEILNSALQKEFASTVDTSFFPLNLRQATNQRGRYLTGNYIPEHEDDFGFAVCFFCLRTTLRPLREVDAGSYRPAFFNAQGDILFLVKASVYVVGGTYPCCKTCNFRMFDDEVTCGRCGQQRCGQISKGEDDELPEYFSLNLRWRNASVGEPALCFIDAETHGGWDRKLTHLTGTKFTALALRRNEFGVGVIFALDPDRIDKSQMQEEENVKIAYTHSKRYHIIESTAAKRRLASIVTHKTFFGVNFPSSPNFFRQSVLSVTNMKRVCYRHPFVIICSGELEFLTVVDVRKRRHFDCILKLRDDHLVSDVAVNTHGVVVLTQHPNPQLHVYAIDDEWLERAMENIHPRYGETMDAAPAYIRTMVISEKTVNIGPLHLDNSFLAYVREDDPTTVKIINLYSDTSDSAAARARLRQD